MILRDSSLESCELNMFVKRMDAKCQHQLINSDVEVYNSIESGILYSTNKMNKLTTTCQNSTTTTSIIGTYKILIPRGCEINTPSIHYRALNIEKKTVIKDKLIEIDDCCDTVKLSSIKTKLDTQFLNKPITGLDQIKDLKGEIIQTQTSWQKFKIGLPEFAISIWTSPWILVIILLIIASAFAFYIYIKYFRMPGRVQATLHELLEMRQQHMNDGRGGRESRGGSP